MQRHVERTRQQISGVVDEPVDVPWRDHHIGAIFRDAFPVDALDGGVQVYHRRDSQGNHRYAQGAPGKLCPAVRHAAAGREMPLSLI